MSDDEITIKLTEIQRTLILDNVMFIEEELKSLISEALKHGYYYQIKMSRGDLEELTGYVAFEANHTDNPSLRRRLDGIGDYFEAMLGEAEQDRKILWDDKFITDKLLPPKGSNMEINFSKEEYRTFLDILEIADWVLFAFRTDEAEELKIYTDFEQKIYSYAQAFGFTNLIMYDEEFGKYFPTNEHDMNSPARPFIDEFENETFWDELTERMAERDIQRELGEKLIKMTREERLLAYHDFEEKYSKEFEKHGIERLKIGD